MREFSRVVHDFGNALLKAITERDLCQTTHKLSQMSRGVERAMQRISCARPQTAAIRNRFLILKMVRRHKIFFSSLASRACKRNVIDVAKGES